ncbi:IclR family transcriptional regulator [Neobacillus mesonae]|uniref:IclR family transcriptional regulator n=1 Tax=Neobacillus mesonae TaxID=1193713 RepID=UPI00203E0449|nr:IclR family transcriptional regulator [Neobacillus mesonae]MCM3568949.1 IclR family transcriptional regulator [Neobacillus mesonae]
MGETVRSVERAIDILTCFTMEEPILTVPMISQKVGLTKSTVFRLLTSLEAKGMVEKIPSTHEYKLGIRLLSIGNVVQSSLELLDIAKPIMKGLADKTQETVNINIAQGMNRICIDKIDGNQVLRKVSEIGQSLPLHKGASGKLLLAFSDPDTITKVLREQRGVMPEAALNHLKIELLDIRERGYATSFSERLEGTASVSAPIKDYTGKVIAGLTVSGPLIRFTEEKVEFFVKEVLESSFRISKSLGYSREMNNSANQL